MKWMKGIITGMLVTIAIGVAITACECSKEKKCCTDQ